MYFHKVPLAEGSSFSIRHDIMPNFGTVWHYHPELELHYVIKGNGIRFIGDNVDNFAPGEIVLLGENLPHTWHCNKEYFDPESKKNVEAIVIHFSPYCFGKEFINLPEAYLLRKLFNKAKNGLLIEGITKEKVASIMQSSIQMRGFDRILALLNILKILSESDEIKQISLTSYSRKWANEYDEQRLNEIYTFTFKNYKKEIKIKDVAEISNLSITSFCRFFKFMTKKTYFQFLTEIRISHACRLLIEDVIPIEAICFECGFKNIANFYRHFKRITGMTPLSYKKQYNVATSA